MERKKELLKGGFGKVLAGHGPCFGLGTGPWTGNTEGGTARCWSPCGCTGTSVFMVYESMNIPNKAAFFFFFLYANCLLVW